ncbi:MAG: DUF1801 domain-containing protein [Bacteroidota bacterium]
MSEVEDFIYEYQDEKRDIMLYFHNLFVNELNLMAKIRFKIPFYYGKSWICYLNPNKSKEVELAFIRGNELSNAHGILETRERKQITSIEIRSVKEAPSSALLETIHEALLLDETTPYASKNKKKK